MAIQTADLESQKVLPPHQSFMFNQPKNPVALKFDELGYNVKIKKQNGFFTFKKPTTEDKKILKGITGTVLPGEMLALLGPSGSGKTTLLTALGGRLSGNLTGTITYNGKAFSNQVKRNMGFVTQDDVLYPHLTVAETLIFTALLRLPNTLSKQEKVDQAEAVITQLGLTVCKDSIIGGSDFRGVSGGERKRVCIGQEMLINPSLLFLDEPTSSLDLTTAQRIVSTLWELVNAGRTVVMTIHQPSSRLFYTFHKMLLLSDGNPLYFGKGGEVMDYFSSIGYTPSVAMNPSDFLLDLASGVYSDGANEDQGTVKDALVSVYKTILADRLMDEQNKIGYEFIDCSDDEQSSEWNTTWIQQFYVLLRRGLKERRHESFSLLKIGQVMVVAFLSGLICWKTSVSHLQDHIGLLFFCTAFWVTFPLFQAIFTFPREESMLKKERASGMYRLSSYFMARTVGDLPMELVLPTIFIIVTYWMAGLKPEADHFFSTLFVILYSVLVAQGLGLALGALVMDSKAATTLAAVINSFYIIAGGYYIQHVPSLVSWIKYMSLNYYMYQLLVGSLYNPEDTYPCGVNETCTVGSFPTIKMVDFDHRPIFFAALGLMFLGYRLLAYLALMRIGATTR